MFKDNSQSSFVSAGYDAFNGASQPYEERIRPLARSESLTFNFSTSMSTSSVTSMTRSSSVTIGTMNSPRAYSFPGSSSYPSFDMIAEVEAKMVNAFYDEGSEPNKRSHTEEQVPQPVQPSQQQFSQSSEFPQMSSELSYQFQATGKRPKKKSLKRIGKKTESSPLIGMLDEITEAYDKPLFIRHVLKNNKVDMT